MARKAAEEGDLVVCELNQIVSLSPEGSNLAFTTQQKINSDNQKKWSFTGKGLNSQLRKHLSDLGFITEIDGKHYQVLLHSPDAPVDEAKLANQLYHLSRCGIAGMLLISAEGQRQLIHAEAVRQDPTGRRYLAVPLLAAR